MSEPSPASPVLAPSSRAEGTGYCPPVVSVRALAPAKINLSLRVRALRPDGYHEITTVFQAVSLTDEVTVSEGDPGTGCTVVVSGDQAGLVPNGDANIVCVAARALAHHAGRAVPDIVIGITKSIPVAAGMAGGSADAAATLVALRRLWGLDVPDPTLAQLAAGIGSDVPFSLMGQIARGTGRGEKLTPVLSDAQLHWVVALSEEELSTPSVYAEWDRLARDGRLAPAADDDADDTELLRALRGGDPRAIARHLVNDLEPAALALRPRLRGVLDAGAELGALAGLVSGSGPTCVFLAEDREGAIALAAEMAGTGLVRGVRHAVGPVPGARVAS